MKSETQPKGQLHHEVEVENYKHGDWKFLFTKSGILNSQDKDAMQGYLSLQNIPDIVFGYSTGLIYNEKDNFGLFINARDALYLCNFDARKETFMERSQDKKYPQSPFPFLAKPPAKSTTSQQYLSRCR